MDYREEWLQRHSVTSVGGGGTFLSQVSAAIKLEGWKFCSKLPVSSVQFALVFTREVLSTLSQPSTPALPA